MTTGTPLLIEHIEAKPGTGTPRITGTGINVSFVAGLVHYHGWDVDRICAEYDLTPGQVYAALSYYADHRDEISQQQQASEAALDRYFEQHPDADIAQQFKENRQDEEE